MGEPSVAAADPALVHRARTSADTLTGLIADGMLHAVGRPERLPELLFPGIPPEDVRAVWDAALAVGYHAGRAAAQPRWTTESLDTARAALRSAGYRALADTVEAAAYAAPSRRGPTAPHPADNDTPRDRP
jgi:hypothetical protein